MQNPQSRRDVEQAESAKGKAISSMNRTLGSYPQKTHARDRIRFEMERPDQCASQKRTLLPAFGLAERDHKPFRGELPGPIGQRRRHAIRAPCHDSPV